MTESIPCDLEHLPDTRSIADVALDKLGCATARPDRGFPVAGRQIVIDHDLVAGLPQRLDGMAADIPGAARDEDRAHGRPIE